MIGLKAGLAAFFLGLWAVLPWPLVRWAAASVGLFLGLGALWSVVLARGLAAFTSDPVLRTFSGRKLEIATRIENRSPLPSGLLFVFDSAGGLETWGETRRAAVVRPFSAARMAFTVRGRERGIRTLGPLRVEGTDPTGFFPFVRQAVPRTLVVYPPLHAVRGWPRDGLPPGPRKWEPALVDDPSRFRSYREFRPGDALAHLSAAAWARAGVPMVRTWDRTVARPTGVVVDLRSGRYPLRLRWALVEAAVEAAATLVWELLGRGEVVWLTVVDAGGPGLSPTLGPGRGWADARVFLERLAVAVPDKETEPSAPVLDVVLPLGPGRFLWVAPPGNDLPQASPGQEILLIPIEEGRPHGIVTHP